MVGAPFRPQGRDPALGLDCVGLVAAAYRAAGRRLPAPAGYPLRGWDRTRIVDALDAAGFDPVDALRREGDVALITYRTGQFHLGLIGRASIIHAHAGLRRVVETPFDGMIEAAPRWRLQK